MILSSFSFIASSICCILFFIFWKDSFSLSNSTLNAFVAFFSALSYSIIFLAISSFFTNYLSISSFYSTICACSSTFWCTSLSILCSFASLFSMVDSWRVRFLFDSSTFLVASSCSRFSFRYFSPPTLSISACLVSLFAWRDSNWGVSWLSSTVNALTCSFNSWDCRCCSAYC